MRRSIVQGFYQSQSTADKVKARLKQQGFTQWAEIYEKNGEYIIKRHFNFRVVFTYIALSIIILIVAHYFLKDFNLQHLVPHLLGFLALVLAGVGSLLLFIFPPQINKKAVEPLKKLLTKGEILLLLEVGPGEIKDALDIMRQVKSGHPVSYLLRPRLDWVLKTTINEVLSEPLVLEQQKARAAEIALECQDVSLKTQKSESLLKRLDEASMMIQFLKRDVAESEEVDQATSTSAEWLLDNMYVIKGSIDDVKKNLPKKFYVTLPKLKKGPFAGLPRIYRIAQEIVWVTGGKLSREGLIEFLNSFQTILPLRIGELWALPLMIRLSLIEGIKNLAMHIDLNMREGELANFWGNRLLHAAHREPAKLEEFLTKLQQDVPEPSPHFAEELMDHLFDEEVVLVRVKDWLEKFFRKPIGDVFHQYQMREAAEQVAFSNAILSLITLSQLSWPNIFESVSLVDTLLRKDPANVYAHMDFKTRNAYRSQIENYARKTVWNEEDVSRIALTISNEATQEVERHVGFYLIDKGKPHLEKAIGYTPRLKEKIIRKIKRYPTTLYAGLILSLSALLEVGFISWLSVYNPSTLAFVLLGIASFLPLTQIATEIVNLFLSKILPTSPLAHMSFEEGIPEEFKTLVVVPSLLMSTDSIEHDLAQLEIRYLANNEKGLNYALFTDYKDALSQETEADHALLDALKEGIKTLQHKYGPRFFLFHRNRKWSEGEKKWIGWERKRGKLEELNRFLMGEELPESPLVVGDKALLAGTKFVLTLDADTQLPKNKGRELVEVLAHILNRPHIDKASKIIQRGYTIIQPRVSSDFSQVKATLFTRLFSEPYVLDPYTNAISNLYQDLADSGSYHGKGIYDVEAFHTLISGRFPQNHLLSHDLLEGAYAGVGFASEVSLWDSFPEDAAGWAARQHRWLRGDFQIIDWLFPRVPLGENKSEKNPLTPINRWKIADNFRRAFVLPSVLALLVISWFVFPYPVIATFVAVGLFILPSIISFLDNLFRLSLFGNREQRDEMVTLAQRAIVNFIWIPFEALITIDALVRVIYRRYVSHQNLLQWTPSAKKNGLRIPPMLTIKGALPFSLGLFALLAYIQPNNWPYYTPVLFLWSLAPLVAYWLGKPLNERADKELTEEDKKLIGLVARKTWRYFDDFMNPENNWLPPDNYQLGLKVELAPRTSPTNIGLGLIAIQAAYDLKYLTCDAALEKMSNTLDTLQKLEKFEGHYLNWYDTTNLMPLYPRYISTVDSGNLIACFWDLKEGLSDVASQPVLPQDALIGCKDLLIFIEREGVPNDTLVALHKIVHAEIHSITGLIQQIEDANHLVQEAATPEGTHELNYWYKKIKEELGSWNEICQRYLSWKAPLNEFKAESDEERSLLQKALLFSPSLTDLSSGVVTRLIETLLEKDSALKDEASKCQWLAGERLASLKTMQEEFESLGDAMDLKFLYNEDRKLLTIGYNLDERRQDNSFYDLLASEARTTSLVGIAKGDLPVEHWWALGRSWTKVDGRKVLISWGGTMFEYLMPLIFTHPTRDSLLGEACRAAVEAQIDYGNKRGIPWGISEAAFSAIDSHKTYQYRSFGIPALGLKRGLEEDLVVSPYSSALALHVMPKEAIQNLKVLAKREGGKFLPPWGFYESIDYTRQKDQTGERGVFIYAFMAHHQGMILASIDNLLNDNVLQRRFSHDRRIAGVESLLNERVPTVSLVKLSGIRHKSPGRKLTPFHEQPVMGVIETPYSTIPKVNLLSNGNLSLMLTNSGGGYSFWNGNDISRWRSDPTTDSWGHFFYVKDLKNNDIWSTAYQPTLKTYQDYNVSFKPDKVEYRRRDNQIETITDITISPEDNAEVTMITFVNHGDKIRQLEVTSYLELALAPHMADRAHQAFSKMFVETEKYDDHPLLLATRRTRSESDPKIWASHIVVGGDVSYPLEYETDRYRFIGRGRNLKNPESLDKKLSGETGYVLDPIFSLRRRVNISPGERVKIVFVTLVADSRDAILALSEKYREISAADRAFELAWNFSQLQMRHLRIHQDEVQLYQKFAGRLFYPHAQLRASKERIKRNKLGQSSLWAQGISGDLPIVTVTIGDSFHIDFIKDVLIAHTFWNMRGLKVDLVILNEEAAGYDQPLFDQIQRLVFAYSQRAAPETPGGVFLRSVNAMSDDEVNLLLAVSRVSLIAARGPLRQQLVTPLPPPYYTKWLMKKPLKDVPSTPLPFLELPYFNGLGGYTRDGKEYVIYLGPKDTTPAPWINVIANPLFGTIATESGVGTTWYANSQSNRLTPWSNDPVINPIKDCLYIRDDDMGVVFTPTAGPIRELDAYRTRHGQGYTIYEHNSHGLEQELTVFVPMDENDGIPAKIQILKLHNTSNRIRRISVTAYAEWVLGGEPEDTASMITTTWDSESHGLFARRPYHPDYGDYMAFTATNPPSNSFTADRTEFLGRNRASDDPEGLRRQSLSGRNGSALDPCSAEQVSFILQPGEAKEVQFIMGYCLKEEESRQIIQQFRQEGASDRMLATTKAWWDKTLGVVQLDSPDLAMNFALNRWILYQNISCRIWGRSAFYQSSGAYGFRDQLQDCMAEMIAMPDRAREYILYAATRQFEEGDVQHWWHPKSGGGVRTRMTDDRLWLVYVTNHYVKITGDVSILDELVSYIKAPILTEDQHEVYNVPEISSEKGTLLEHCERAIKISQTAGSHGLPLMGGGDWNDGMNRVGEKGLGESVWLAWFFGHTLNDYADLLELKGRDGSSFRKEAKQLAEKIEEGGWDGEWYRRAYFDDGSPLGAKGNEEAFIDSLAQSWSAISGLGQQERIDMALKSAETYLVKEEDNTVLLLTPPFNVSHPDPGYIRSYPPGVRENGGQYTHGSLWLSMAFARQGEGSKALSLLRMMHPISHTENQTKCSKYRLEPYILAADIYDLPKERGRGGWSWYTGSSGWCYRILLEEILGFKKQGDTLVIDPSMPKEWDAYTITYRYENATYTITVKNPQHKSKGKVTLTLNGTALPDNVLPLTTVGNHTVEAVLG